MQSTTTVHFIITGEHIAERARDLMLSDEPGKAYRLLAQGLGGEGVDEVARKVLAGELDLTGDSAEGVGTKPAEDVEQYLEDLAYIYAGRVRLDQCWYRPRAIVTSYGPKDARAAGRVPAPGLKPSARLHAWSLRRAAYYAQPGERVEVARVHGRGRHVIFEPCGECPHWLKPPADAQQAVDAALAAGRRLDEVGAHGSSPSSEARQIAREHGLDEDEADELLELAHQAEDELFDAQCQRIAERVREQAGDDVFELELLDGRTVSVPRPPFVRWALARLDSVDPASLPAWDTVAPSGLKLQLDNPDHTDWMLGAGLSLNESYDSNVTEPAWDKLEELQEAARRGRVKYAGIRAALEMLDASRISASVIVDAGKQVGIVGESIAVFPDSSPARVKELHPGIVGVLVERGGALAHFAVVTRGKGITVMRAADACERFPIGTRVSLNPAEGRIIVDT